MGREMNRKRGELDLFAYFPGTSPLHRLDPRMKIGAVVITCIAVFLSSRSGLPILTALLAVYTLISRYPLLHKNELRKYRALFLLALFIFLGRTVFSATPGKYLFMIGGQKIGSIYGLREGTIGAWRLLLFVWSGILFTVTTSVMEMKNGIASLLRPVPFVPEQKIGFMFGLTITFVPVVFKTASEIREVHTARGAWAGGAGNAAYRGNRLRHLRLFAVHLISAIGGYVEEATDALYARGFTGKGKPVPLSSALRDWVLLFIAAAAAAVAVIADRLLPVPFLA